MRLHHLLLTALLASTSVACESKPHDLPTEARAPQSTSLSGFTAQKSFFVEVTPSPSPIPFQELFALDVTVHDAQKNALADAQIDEVRAVMPAHNHGMNVRPEVTSLGDGKFRVEGMRFHMRGDGEDGLWVLELVINHQGTIDQTQFEVQCCQTP